MTAPSHRPVFRLTFADGATSPELDPGRPEALIWLSPVDGSVWAYGDRVDGENWLRIPGVATFRFGGAADEPGEATAIPEAGVPREAVTDAYRRAVLPIALHVHGLEVLHASAVVTPHGVVAFCAESHGGKSTIAYACERRGYPVWADDAVAFHPLPNGAEVVPLPFTLRLRAPASAFFEEPPPDAARPPGHAREDGEPASLAAVVILERSRDEAAAVAIEPVPSAQAFAAVFEHAYWFDLRSVEQRRETMRRYLDLVARVPVHRIRYPTGFDHLPRVADALGAALAASR
ncbi:MAG: hypothetical protein M3265_11055 [Actinomycetota bacterium]|nr:hypothetical protein [Actinomycetota bacterium]